MNLRDRLRSALGIIFNNRDDGVYGRDSMFGNRWSEPPSRSTEEWLETYGKSPRLSVVTKIAEDLAYVEGRLFHLNAKGEEEELPEDHPFWTFWDAPNPLPQFTKAAIWQLHQTYLLLTGEAFMVIEKDACGYPAELWPIPPHWVMTTPVTGNPFYGIRTPSNMMGQIHVSDMFVQMELNPLDPYGRGLGPAQSIADEVEIDEYAAQFEKRFFYNDATPNSIIGIEGADHESVRRFEAEWNNRFKGVDNSHGTAFASGKVTAAKLGENMKDLDMIQGRKFMRDSVLEHFHVPREIMGITENSNRSTAEAAQYIYAQNVQTPYISKRSDAVNPQLVAYWGDDVYYRYNDIIPRNQEFEKQVAVEGYMNELLLLNEGREKLGMEPLPNGDVLRSQLLFGYVRPDQDLSKAGMTSDMGGADAYYDETYEEVDPETGRKEIKARVSRLDQQAMQQLERAQREQERHSQNAVAQHFSHQRNDLIRAIRQSGTAQKDANASGDLSLLQLQLASVDNPIRRAEMITGFVEKLTDWQGDAGQVQQLLTNIWSCSYNEAQGIMENLYNLQNPHKPEVRDIFKRMGGQRIGQDISATTRDSIVKIIDNGLEEGVDVSELARRIGDSGDLSPSRAKLIAEQETYNALSAANYDSMEEGGVRRHKWVTRGVDLVRPSHRALNGQVRNVGEPFSNGLMYPRDRNGSAAEVVHCRCWTVPLRERDSIFVPS